MEEANRDGDAVNLNASESAEPQTAEATTLGDLGLTPRDAPDLHHYWPGLLRALGTEPVDLESLRGASGLDHSFIAAGVDEERRRLIGVSNEPDATGAAMAQADLQAGQSDVQVVLARAVIVDIGAIGETIQEKVGRPVLVGDDLEVFQQPDQDEINQVMAEVFQPLAQQAFNARAVGSVSFLQGLVQFIKQAAKADWGVEEKSDYLLNLSSLLQQPVTAEDGAVGVCPIPLYAFSEEELEAIHLGKEKDQIEEILRGHDLFQYFFPPPDQTALALVDRAPQQLDVIRAVEDAPRIGHPFGREELIPDGTSLPHLLDQLKERGYVAEVDYGYELTGTGKEVRARVQAKPREGFVSKLINRFSVKINLRSIFKIGG